MKRVFHSSFIPMAGLLLFLGGCRAVGPDYQRPNSPGLSPTFRYGKSQASIDAEWWKNFRDSTLTRLIQQARRANFDLAQAEAHIRESRALAQSAELGDVSAQLVNSAAVAGWELDLFGKYRRGEEAANANVESAEALRDAALVSVSAEVATAYLELRGSQQAYLWATRTIEGSSRTLDLSRKSIQLGRATEFDATRMETQLAENRAALPPLRQAQETALARLAVLTGQPPGVLDRELSHPAPVPFVPDSVASGLPSDLLRNRPDVRAAERELAAAVAAIGIETADLYPRLSLGGTLSYSVGKPSGFLWNGGPNLSWAAFDIPRVRTHIAAAQARADGALARYQQTVLKAAEEATTALSTWQHQRERRDQLRYAVALSRNLNQQSRKRMDAGILTLPNVIEAEQARFNAERQLAESETETATDLVAVYKALGGGWKR